MRGRGESGLGNETKLSIISEPVEVDYGLETSE